MPHNDLPSQHQSVASPVCLVTGGSSGIGLAIANKFASQGFRLAICGRQPERLQQAAQQIRQNYLASTSQNSSLMPDSCFSEVVDLTDIPQSVQFAEQVFQQLGRIDVLVNNAAAAPLAAFESIAADEFEHTLNSNIRSVFYLTQSIWRRWISPPVAESDELTFPTTKTIINISSLSAVDPFPQFSIYGASKAWLDLMTHALAVEGEPHGIRVCSIRPGAVETPLLRSLFPDFPPEQCAAPESVAELAWNCHRQPQNYPSGKAFVLN